MLVWLMLACRRLITAAIALCLLAALPCSGYSASGSTILTNLSLGAGEWNITFTGVTFKSTVLIDVSAMLLNTTRYITFTNCFMAGTSTTVASIFILGAQSQATSNQFQPSANVLFFFMTATQASILFNGTFPPKTHIDIIGTTITTTGVVTYLQYYAAGLIFSNMLITSFSAISIVRSNLTMTGSTASCPGAFGLQLDNVNISEASTLIVQNSTISARSSWSSSHYTSAIDVANGLVVSGHSYALFSKLVLTSIGSTDTVVAVEGYSPWVVLNYSAILIDSCNITFDATSSSYFQHLFWFEQGLVVEGHSWFAVRNIRSISIKGLLSVFNVASAAYKNFATLTFSDSFINHTGASSSFLFYSTFTAPVNDSTFVMVVRCFYLNGLLMSSPAQWGSSYCTFIACGTCAAQVDCFTPNTVGLTSSVYPMCSCNCAHQPSNTTLSCLPSNFLSKSATVSSAHSESITRTFEASPSVTSSRTFQLHSVTNSPTTPRSSSESKSKSMTTAVPSSLAPTTALPSSLDPTTAVPSSLAPTTMTTAVPSSLAPTSMTTAVPSSLAPASCTNSVPVTIREIEVGGVIFGGVGAQVPMAELLLAGQGLVLFTAAPGFTFSLVAALALPSTKSSVGKILAITMTAGNSTMSSVLAVLVSFADISVSLLPISAVMTLDVTVGNGVYILGPGLCDTSGMMVALNFSCLIEPLKRAQNARLKSTVQTTFQSTTTASAVLMNPVTAMANTGMISIQQLQQCVFSDVEPLDPPVSPLNATVGGGVGQYYRGAVATGLGVYGGAALVTFTAAFLFRVVLKKPDGVEFVRLPSILMIPVSLFHQGIVSSGTSLIRLADSSGDIALGIVGIVTGTMIAGAVALATTRFLTCRIEKVDEARMPSYEKKIPGLKHFLKLAMWEKHWVDGHVAGYKRRYWLLLDDLAIPSWTAVELSSGLVQGIIVGVRRNDASVCRQQLIALVIHCVVIFAGAVYLRPCGSLLGNMFLIGSKLGCMLVAVTQLDYIIRGDESAMTASQYITAAFTFLSSVQTACQLLVAIVLISRFIAPKVSLRLAEESSQAAAAAADRTRPVLVSAPPPRPGTPTLIAPTLIEPILNEGAIGDAADIPDDEEMDDWNVNHDELDEASDGESRDRSPVVMEAESELGGDLTSVDALREEIIRGLNEPLQPAWSWS